MLHLVSLHELVVLARNNLEKIVQGLVIFLVVATSYEVELTKWAIDTLKIMWELVLLVNSDNLRKLVLKLDLENLLRVLLQEMDSAERWALVLISFGYWDHLLVCLIATMVGGETWHCHLACIFCCRRWWSPISWVAETPLFVSFQFFERKNLSASSRALESEVLKHFKHYPILGLHDVDLVADCTFKFILINISLAASFSKIRQTVFASTL